jgi:hypothetical protein
MERIVNLERDHKEKCTLHVTCFSQARCVHEHLKALGQAETTRPTKSSMTDCHCCRPNCWSIGDVALTKV